MGANIHLKNDYSSLFTNLNNNSVNNMNWLSDYASIKNGSYNKLMKAYYAQDDNSEISKLVKDKQVKSEKNTVDTEVKAYNKVQTEADKLQSAVTNASGLKADSTQEDIAAVVDDFIKSYNSLIDAVSDKNIEDTAIDGRLNTIKTATTQNESGLNSIGVTIDSDGKLALDKEKLAEAAYENVTKLLGQRADYGRAVYTSAGMIESNASFDASRFSSYNSNGGHNTIPGNLWDSIT